MGLTILYIYQRRLDTPKYDSYIVPMQNASITRASNTVRIAVLVNMNDNDGMPGIFRLNPERRPG